MQGTRVVDLERDHDAITVDLEGLLRGVNLLRSAAAAAALACTMFGAETANAEPFVFKLDAGPASAFWIQDSTPTPRNYDYFNHWTTMIVSGNTAQRGPIGVVEYFDANYYGPGQSTFAIFPTGGSYLQYFTSGLYTGSAGAPVFHSGVYNVTVGPGAPEYSGTATLSVHPVAPAPLAGAGLLAALATLAGFAMARPRAFAAFGRKLKDRLEALRLA